MQAITIQNFQQEVVDASMQVPVLVDFWAEWCGPCKQLTPLLAKLEAQYAGRLKLVTVDTEAQPQLAQHFQIKSLPTVYAFVNGQPVDQFQGLQTEATIKAFIDKLMPNPADLEFEQAMQLIEQGNIDDAIAPLKKAITLDPAFDEARMTYAQVLLQKDEPAAALEQLEALTAAAKADPNATQIIQAAQAMQAQRRLPPLPEVEARISANPKDLVARLELAQHCIAHKAWEEAFEQLIAIVATDRTFQEDIGRKTMIDVFKLAEAQPALVSAWRRKLSSALN
jgi:putative thioredoxin